MTAEEALEVFRLFGYEKNGVWRIPHEKIRDLCDACHSKGRILERNEAIQICAKSKRKSNLIAVRAATSTEEAIARGSASASGVIAEALAARV